MELHDSFDHFWNFRSGVEADGKSFMDLKSWIVEALLTALVARRTGGFHPVPWPIGGHLAEKWHVARRRLGKDGDRSCYTAQLKADEIGLRASFLLILPSSDYTIDARYER